MNAGERGDVEVTVLSARAGFELDREDAERAELVALAGDGVEALAAGLAGARGELAIWLRSGDELLPGAVSRLLAAVSARPGVALVYPAYRRRDSDGEEGETVVPEEFAFSEMLMFQQAPIGAGALFRTGAGLAAARAAAPSPLAEFAFWLRLASTGTVLRLLETLAVRRPVPAPERAALSASELARERLAVLEQITAATDLPAGSEAVLRSAARSACVLAALDFAPTGFDPEERFFVADRLTLETAGAATDPDAELAWLEAQQVVLQQRLNRTRAVLPALREALGAREAHLADPGPGPGGARHLISRLVRR